MKAILLNPGKFSKDFVEGRRKKYMKPISMFLLANLIYFLFPMVNTFTTSLDYQTRIFSYSDIAKEWVDLRVADREISFETYEQEYNEKTAELSKLLLILMAFMLALCFLPIHIGSQQNLLADHFTIGLEVMSFTLRYNFSGLSFVLVPVIKVFPSMIFIFSNFWLTSISVAFLIYFFSRMQYTFYGFRGLRLVINVVLCVLSVNIVLITYRGILFFVTFWLT